MKWGLYDIDNNIIMENNSWTVAGKGKKRVLIAGNRIYQSMTKVLSN